MTEEIKIDGNSIQIGNKVCYCVVKDLIDYITNLQQLYKNGLKVNRNSHKYITELETRIYSCLDGIDRTIEIIKQQPTKDDSWILSRLYGLKYSLNGSDEK